MEIARQEAQQYLLYARYYGPEDLFRFPSVDPSISSVEPTLPMTWNRFIYVRNNPLLRIDSDGRSVSVL